MRKVSKKRAQQNKEYSKLRIEYLNANPSCERCASQATEIHHKAGRNGDRLNDVSNFMAICRTCHNYIHANPKESRENEWLK